MGGSTPLMDFVGETKKMRIVTQPVEITVKVSEEEQYTFDAIQTSLDVQQDMMDVTGMGGYGTTKVPGLTSATFTFTVDGMITFSNGGGRKKTLQPHELKEKLERALEF